MRLIFFFCSFRLYLELWGNNSLAAPRYTHLLYTGSRPLDFRALFTWVNNRNLVQKRKNCTLHLVAFAVSLFCWFSVVV